MRLVRENASNSILLTERGTGAEHAIGFDEQAYALGLAGGYEFDTTTLRFVYESPTTPAPVVRLRHGHARAHPAQDPGDPLRPRSRRLCHPPPVRHARPTATEVPITVLMRRDTPLDGSAPLLLYGYGAYGIPMEPHFLDPQPVAWSTAAGSGPPPTSAAARRRAGAGSWTGAGATSPTPSPTSSPAPRHLVAGGYGRAGRIVAYGGSAGGMLMGAIANMRPELWAGIIAAVPFVDVLNTMSDASLPLTPPEWPEWGNPLEDPAAYDLIASYSPYDNVAAKPYPAVLATGGLSDPRVTYWEPAKWVARLRDAHHRRRADAAEDQHGGRPRRRVRAVRVPQGDRPRLRLRHLGGGARLGGAVMRIRPATADDAAALAAIYGHHVIHGSGTFEATPPAAREMAARLAAVVARGLPYLAAEIDGAVAGFAYAAPFRTRAAYRFTVEDSVYIAPAAWVRASARPCWVR